MALSREHFLDILARGVEDWRKISGSHLKRGTECFGGRAVEMMALKVRVSCQRRES